jgi:hypothetical protein
VLWYSVGKVTRGGENTGIIKGKELFVIESELFPTGTNRYLAHHCAGTGNHCKYSFYIVKAIVILRSTCIVQLIIHYTAYKM